MGNSSSNSKFLEPVEQVEARWEQYSTAGWRSMRVRELDELGGPGRAAVQSGSSFTSKLQLLEEHLQDKRTQMQDMLSLSPAKPKDASDKGSGTRRFMMHTDKRAAERAGELEDIATVMIGQKELAAVERLASVAGSRPGSQAAPNRQLKGHHSAPVGSPAGSPNASPHQQQLLSSQSRGRHVPLADWRKRVHAARRRTMIAIIAMLRFRRGHKHHPQRPFRLDDLSFYIPEHLAAEKERFIKEYQKYIFIQEQIKTLELALAELGADTLPVDKLLSHTHSGADGGVLSQLTLPACPDSPAASRLYRSMLSGRSHHSPQPPPLPPMTPNGDGVKSPIRPIRRSSTDAGRGPRPVSAGPAGPQSSNGSSPTAAPLSTERTSMQSIQESVSINNREWELSRRARPLSLSGVPGPPGQAQAPAASRPQRQSNTGEAAPGGSSGGAGSPGGPGRRLRPASLSGGYDPAFAEANAGGRPGSAMRRAAPASVPSITARAVASPGRAGWNQYMRRSADTGPSPPSSRAMSVERTSNRALTRSETATCARTTTGPVASGATINRVSRQNLQQQVKHEMEALQASASLLQMYLNRVNSAWADARRWAPAPVIGAAEETLWCRNDQHEIYQADTLRKIRNGKVAIELFAGDDRLETPSGDTLALWSSDPWSLVEACRPGMMPPGERIKGVPLGARVLCNLATQVTQLVGKDALDRVFLVLHLNDLQEPEVTSEMWSRGFYGFNRNNVVFLVQEQHPGFTYDSQQRMFTKADGDSASSLPTQLSGTGVAMSQMAWPSEAFVLNDAGVKQPLMLPAMDYLHNAGVEWVVARRVRDMSVFCKDGVMDLSALAHRLHMRDRSRASMVVDVVMAESAATARHYGTVVLQQHREGEEPKAPPSPSKLLSPSPSQHTTELCFSELASPQLLELVETSLATGKLAVGMGRYMYHLPTMKKLLACSTLWRPHLQLTGSTLQVQLDMCDVTAVDTMHCIPVEARRHAQLLSAETIDALIPLTQAQDADSAFKQMVTERITSRTTPTTSVTGAASPSVEVVGGDAGQGLSIVVFIANNAVANKTVQTALYLARPGRDTVHFVTVVAVPAQRAEGQAFLDDFARQALQLMLDVRADVLVRGSTGLLDCMEAYLVQRCYADSTLVVLGSVQLTLSVFDSVMGSVAVAMLRRMVGLPMVVVTANAKNAPAPGSGSGHQRNSHTGSGGGSGGVLKVMITAETHSRPLCNMVCTQLLSTRSRGDKLLLAQVLPNQLTTQQAATQRRLLENFQTMTISHRCPADKALVLHCTPGGSMDEPLLQAVEEQGVGLLAVQVPAGSKSLPKPLLKVLRSCKGAVLLYQEAVSGDGNLIRQMKALDG